MRVAVTGATGFTGRRVVAELLRRGHDVTALVRPPAAGRAAPGVRVVEGDLADASALKGLLAGQHALLYAASLGFGHAEDVTRAVEAEGVERAIFFSSTALFTRLPAASRTVRIEAEEHIRSLSCAWTILRPTMIYGDEGDRNLSRLVRFVTCSPVVPLPGGGRALVQPVHVDDLGRAAADALASSAASRREYNLPGAEAASLQELVRHVARLLGRRVVLVPLPLRPAAALAGIWRRIGLPPRISSEQVLRLGEDKAFAFDDAAHDFGYAPRGYRDGLADEVRRLKETGFIR
jgi:uncharacterized protein YbjT (DUF2867 family)